MKNFSKYAVLAVFTLFAVFLVGVFVGRINNQAITLDNNTTQATKAMNIHMM